MNVPRRRTWHRGHGKVLEWTSGRRGNYWLYKLRGSWLELHVTTHSLDLARKPQRVSTRLQARRIVERLERASDRPFTALPPARKRGAA